MTQTMVENAPTTRLLGNGNIQSPYHLLTLLDNHDTVEVKLPYLTLPDHTQLPDENGTFVKNFQEHPQSILLTDSILPKLREIQPDNQFAIGQDCGIYWRLTVPPEPLYKGAECPDWFYVPNVPPMLDGTVRRSYVMWQEQVVPLIALEFVSGDGSEERDKTPNQGKFWVYEQAIRIPYYGIYEVKKATVEMYRLVSGHYELMLPNQYGQYEIPELDVAVGIWHGAYNYVTLPWMRWWDRQGNLLPTSEEQLLVTEEQLLVAEEQLHVSKNQLQTTENQLQMAEERLQMERLAKEQERQAKELAQQELAQLRAKLHELGLG